MKLRGVFENLIGKKTALAPAPPTPQSLGRELCALIDAQLAREDAEQRWYTDPAEHHRLAVDAAVLIDAGAALDVKSGYKNDWQPLQLAALGGYEELAGLLVKAGAPLEDADNERGRTPAQEARLYPKIVEMIETAIAVNRKINDAQDKVRQEETRRAEIVAAGNVVLRENVTLPNTLMPKFSRRIGLCT